LKYKFLPLLVISTPLLAQVPSDLVLEDPEDIQLLMEEFPDEAKSNEKMEKSSMDDLEALKEDLGDIEFALPDEDIPREKDDQIDTVSKPEVLQGELKSQDAKMIFDVGKEEKELLEMAKNMQGKIPSNEWSEIAGATTKSTYTVQKNDWLWKISKKLFGSGFYYSKIWALNPYITNPHEIEPGMVLNFNTGNQDNLPEITVYRKQTQKVAKVKKTDDPYAMWGDEATPEWIREKERLKKQGVFVQYSTLETDEDLKEASSQNLIREYEAYEPPRPDFNIEIPQDEYDATGFDRNAKVTFNFKEGFYLNTFLSTNIVQDFGKVDSAVDEKQLFTKYDNVYVTFDESIDVVIGDKFSIYTAQGKTVHPNSDREGFKYTVVGSIQIKSKVGDKWKCELIESAGVVSRGDRITVYTPKIDRITKTFNSRMIEAVLVGAYNNHQEFASFGDVIYIDRGRADGVEMGNVFEIYGFRDRGTGRNITENPTYKNGEITVISLTDNFATALVTSSVRDFEIGDIAVTKTKEAAARTTKLRERLESGADSAIKDKALDELDVELNLDDLNDSLLDKADSIQFTEDELSELERQEREKSIMGEGEKDLKALERLELEIESAEKLLNQSRLDEDKYLEGESLDSIEQNLLYQQQESLDELEENFGKRYLDEDLNDKENPFGLTEFDIEEMDELMNVEKSQKE
jgi:hypothetical protein